MYTACTQAGSPTKERDEHTSTINFGYCSLLLVEISCCNLSLLYCCGNTCCSSFFCCSQPCSLYCIESYCNGNPVLFTLFLLFSTMSICIMQWDNMRVWFRCSAPWVELVEHFPMLVFFHTPVHWVLSHHSGRCFKFIFIIQFVMFISAEQHVCLYHHHHFITSSLFIIILIFKYEDDDEQFE